MKKAEMQSKGDAVASRPCQKTLIAATFTTFVLVPSLWAQQTKPVGQSATADKSGIAVNASDSAKVDIRQTIIQRDPAMAKHLARLEDRLRSAATQQSEMFENMKEHLALAVARVVEAARQPGRSSAAQDALRDLTAGDTRAAERFIEQESAAEARKGAEFILRAAESSRQVAALAAGRDSKAAIAAYRKAVEYDPTNADSWRALGDLLAEADSTTEAINAYRRSLDLADARIKQNSADVEAQADIALGYKGLARALLSQGQPTQSANAYEIAVATQRALIERNPQDPAPKAGLADIFAFYHNTLAALGDRAKRFQVIQEGLAIREDLSNQSPADLSLRYAVSDSLLDLASAHAADESFDQAAEAQRKAHGILGVIVAREPSNNLWQHRYANSFSQSSNIATAVGNRDLALAEARQALSIFERLRESDPTNKQWLLRVAYASIRESAIHRSRSDPKAAMQSAQAALTIAEAAAARFPDGLSVQHSRADAYVSVGAAHFVAGNYSDAARMYERANQVRDDALKGSEATSAAASNRAGTINQIGVAYSYLGNHSEARTNYRTAIGILEQVASLDANNYGAKTNLARAYGNIGRNIGRSDPGLAEEYFRKQEAVANELIKLRPASNAAQRILANALSNLAGSQLSSSPTAASALVRRAIEIRERLNAGRPSDGGDSDLANDYTRMGNFLRGQGDGTAALGVEQKLLDLRLSRYSRNQSDSVAQGDLASSHVRIAQTYSMLKDSARTIENYRNAISIYERAVGADPTNTRLQTSLASAYASMGAAYAAQKDHNHALDGYRKALAVREKLYARDAANLQLQSDMAANYRNLGSTLKSLGDETGSIGALRSMVTIRERLTTMEAENMRRQAELAMAYWTLTAEGGKQVSREEHLLLLDKTTKLLRNQQVRAQLPTTWQSLPELVEKRMAQYR